MSPLKLILLHRQKWVPKIGKQTNVAEPALRPLGQKSPTHIEKCNHSFCKTGFKNAEFESL